jgi:hypothetical protein
LSRDWRESWSSRHDVRLLLRGDGEAITAAVSFRKVREARIVGHQRTAEFDRGRNQQAIRRVAMVESAKRGGAVTYGSRRDSRAVEKAVDPCRDPNVQIDPLEFAEQREFPMP